MAGAGSRPRSFASAARFRAWLERNHATRRELEIRLFKKHAAQRGMGYAEALDEALCFGWIDGVTHALDADRYRVRFTPRRPGSKWSLVNIRHARRLVASGRMHAAGLAAFRARDENDARRYSFEARRATLAPAFARKLRANARAWAFFRNRPAGYRRTSSFWVMSAKRPETRERRLQHLIACSEQGQPIGPLAGAAAKRAAGPRRKSR